MKIRNLYFVSEYERPQFPIQSLANEFEVIKLNYPLEDSNWFDWNRPGCLVCETSSIRFATSVLDGLRMSWISIPSILYSTDSNSQIGRNSFASVAGVYYSQENRGVRDQASHSSSLCAPIDYQNTVYQNTVYQNTGAENSLKSLIAPQRTLSNSTPQNLIDELTALVELDKVGSPSPFELRKRFGRLSNQERVVLNLSLQGQTSREISRLLEIRSQTVDKYRRNALQRMKAKNLVELLRHLYDSMYRNWETLQG